MLQDICLVEEAADGAQALRLLREKSPRLMLLDVSMPGMSGLDVLKAARAARTNLTVIMLTSLSDMDTAQQALALGALMYVTKPYDAAYLRREVERLLLLPSSQEPNNDRPWRIAS